MKSKIAKDILDSTPQHIKDKAKEYADNKIISKYILNLSLLTEEQLDYIFNKLKTKKVDRGLKWKIDNYDIYLERTKSFYKFHKEYLYLWVNGPHQYTTDNHIPNPNFHETVTFEEFKVIHNF